MRRTVGVLLLLSTPVFAEQNASPAHQVPPDPATATEIEALKHQIESNQRDLALERERSSRLQRKLECTEALLNRYGQCTEHYDTASQAYWNCVQGTVASRGDPCQTE